MNACSIAPVSGVSATALVADLSSLQHEHNSPSPIQPCRGALLQLGDVVKLNPADRRRVLSIAEVPGTIWMQGTWEVLTGPHAPYFEQFQVAFIRWFTIERRGVNHAR